MSGTTRTTERLSAWTAWGVCSLLNLFWCLQSAVNDDDIYHLHSTWLVGDGLLPYRDFFEIHPPGFWLIAAPLVHLFERPSTLFLAGRITTALIAGALVYAGARLVRASSAPTVFLTLLFVGVMQRCQMWMFRVEFVAVLLLMVHLVLLAHVAEGTGGRWHATAAAAVLALACTMSIRVVPFVALQPLAILAWRRDQWRAQALCWIGGGLVGIAPSAVYLSWHGLWADLFLWAFRFVASDAVVVWSFEIDRAEIVLLIFGVTAIALSWWCGTLASRRLALLTSAWVVSFAFHLANPQKVDYAGLSLLLTTILLLTAAAPALAPQHRRLARDTALVLLGVSTLFFGRLVWWLPTSFNREMQAGQLLVLDWLRVAAGSEPVVLIAPYHPMMVRDATDLQNPAYYHSWLVSQALHDRLDGFAATVLHHPPPVIAADPWPKQTNGRDLIAWLRSADVFSDADAAALRELLATRYTLVSFEPLAAAHDPPFGHRFWVRNDRLAAHPPPRVGMQTRTPG